MNGQRLTKRQFEALAKLLRLRKSAAARAAYTVLVDGGSAPEAIRTEGITPTTVYACVRACEEGVVNAKEVVLGWNGELLTERGFKALSKLLRLRKSAAARAAYTVLVNGGPAPEAARTEGIMPTTVYACVRA